jgi:nitrite reductase/ring-hydroxylating ferredoxin subunit
MDRKDFLKVCGGACLGVIGIPLLLERCTSTHYVQAQVSGNQLSILKDEFKMVRNEKTSFRKHIIIKTESLEYPIIVYRLKESEYKALLMRCTHQGVELNANGDILTCSAHGSEFSNKGEVIQGPADKKLKTFNVNEDEKNIYVQIA